MRGYFDAPWTDTLALLFCVLGMELAWRFAECIISEKGVEKLLIHGLMLAVSVFLASIFRSSFKINALLLPLCTLFFALAGGRESKKGKMRTTLLGGGVLLLTVIFSFVLIGKTGNQLTQLDLMYKQLSGGLEYQKADYSDGLMFENPIGLRMSERLGVERRELTYAEDKKELLLQFAKEFPAQMIG